MVIQKVLDTQHIVQQISDILLMNGGFLNNPGLYAGEMGLVLFFTRYARFTNNDVYSDYSCNLIDKMQNRIHRETPLNYKHGLAGIGSAIEYLAQNGFLEADTDEILEDFDKRLFYTYNICNLPSDEILDIGYYTIWRMSGNSSHKNMMRYTILPSLMDAMREQCMSEDFVIFKKIMTLPDSFIISELQKMRLMKIPNGYWEHVESYYLEYIEKGKGNIHLGLQGGLTGCGISLLTKLDRDDTWISLLPNNYYLINDELIPV